MERAKGGVPERRFPCSRNRLNAVIRAAAAAGTRKAARSEPNPADTRPVSHGTRAPPKEALENTQPPLREASIESEAKDNNKGKMGARPRAVTEAATRTCRLERANR